MVNSPDGTCARCSLAAHWRTHTRRQVVALTFNESVTLGDVPTIEQCNRQPTGTVLVAHACAGLCQHHVQGRAMLDLARDGLYNRFILLHKIKVLHIKQQILLTMAQLHFLGLSGQEIRELLMLQESLDSPSPVLKALNNKLQHLRLQPHGTSYPPMVSFHVVII